MIELPSVHDENRRIAMLQSLGLTDARTDESLEALAELAADLMDAPIGLVTLIGSESIFIAAAAGYRNAHIDRWDSFCGHMLSLPEDSLWVEDARADPRFRDSRYVVGDPHIRFYAGVALTVNGCKVGTLCTLGPECRSFDPSLAKRLKQVGKACMAELAERHRTHALRQALVASADALVDCNGDGTIVSWSDGAERMFGYSRLEAVGQEVTLIMPPEHHLAHREGMRRWRLSGHARLGRRLELPAQRQDGSPLDIELWMSVSHVAGEPRVHANIRDISHRVEQARDLLAATARAEEASLAKTAFLANMSHELRTPLNGIIGCAGLLAASPNSCEQSKLIAIVQDAAGQLSRLIADILDLARIESGEVKLHPTATDLPHLINTVVDLCRLKADEKGVNLRCDIDPSADCEVCVDSARMKQILGNLISNAVKFTNEGEVSVRVFQTGAVFRFEVQDTGIGFSPEVQAVIFDRFQQADPSITRRFGGTGLGLAICRDLVQAMGGELQCCSSPGEGSLFWIEIDLPWEVRDLKPAPVLSEPSSTRAEIACAALRVLVTDDNATNRQVAGLILASAGLETDYAEDGREALDLIAKHRFDIVLMDMMMPEMDGIEATRRLRAGQAGPENRDLPVIMLTANTLPEHVAESLSAGADAHLAKPITPAALLAAVSGALEARQNPQPVNAVALAG